jgi:hypothetical protein
VDTLTRLIFFSFALLSTIVTIKKFFILSFKELRFGILDERRYKGWNFFHTVFFIELSQSFLYDVNH